MKAGIPKEVTSMLVNMLCGSGLKAVVLGAQSIQCGSASVVIAGGQESMSQVLPHPPHPLHFFPLSLSVPSHTTPQAPHCVQMRAGVKFGDTPLVDTMMKDGLVDAFHGYSMGTTAENVAKQYGITRADQDHFSALSQQHTEAAQKAGCFKAEIVPVTVPSRKGHLCCSV